MEKSSRKRSGWKVRGLPERDHLAPTTNPVHSTDAPCVRPGRGGGGVTCSPPSRSPAHHHLLRLVLLNKSQHLRPGVGRGFGVVRGAAIGEAVGRTLVNHDLVLNPRF